MHVIFRESQGLEETETPTDLGQSPADLVVLSLSDSDLGACAAGWHRARDAGSSLPDLRLANIAALKHPLSVDTYVEQTLDGAKAILIRLIGGFFLVGKSVHEIHHKLEGDGEHVAEKPKAVSFASVLIQIAILDIVFSLDSVITAVGMADDLAVMIIAVVVAVGVMMVGAGPISDFVHKHPTIKMLALAFLILIGVTLIAEGLNQHISKGYIYTAMAFALIVEFLNIRSKRGNDTPSVELIEPHALAGASGVPEATQIVRTTHPAA